MFTKRPPSEVYADLGSNLTLCCEAEGSVSWTRAGRWSQSQSLRSLPGYRQNGCLTISNVKEESAGIYTCSVRNSFGISESTSAVMVTGCYEFSVLFSVYF